MDIAHNFSFSKRGHCKNQKGPIAYEGDGKGPAPRPAIGTDRAPRSIQERSGLAGDLSNSGRHLLVAECFSILTYSGQPAVSGNHLAIARNEDRICKAKALDGIRNLPDLPLRMGAGVAGVRANVLRGNILNRKFAHLKAVPI